MKKIKRVWARLKRFMRALETYDRMNDGKLCSALLAMMCLLAIIMISLIFAIFG